MASPVQTRGSIAWLVLGLLPACGGGATSPPAVTAPAAALRANLGITSLSVSGEARPVGQAYRVTVHLHESAGMAAAIAAVDLTFTNGSIPVVSSHVDQPISDAKSENVCPAGGSVDTRELVVVDDDPSHAYATSAQARVTFTDSSMAFGTVTATVGVPALPPPPPKLFTLTGVVVDSSTNAVIAGARVEVLNGSNAGAAAVTDASGTYVMRDLVADSFRLRASANNYAGGEQDVALPANSRVDFALRGVAPRCTYSVSPDTMSFSHMGFPETCGLGASTCTITVTTQASCPWTVTADGWIFLAAPVGSPFSQGQSVSGTGPLQAGVGVGVNLRPCNLIGSVRIRWDGGGADVRVVFAGQPTIPPATLPSCSP